MREVIKSNCLLFRTGIWKKAWEALQPVFLHWCEVIWTLWKSCTVCVRTTRSWASTVFKQTRSSTTHLARGAAFSKFDFFFFHSLQTFSRWVSESTGGVNGKRLQQQKKNRPTPQGKNSFDISVKIEKLHWLLLKHENLKHLGGDILVRFLTKIGGNRT